MNSDLAIDISDVSFRYGEKPVLRHIDLQLSFSRTYCLIGASGSGKTTLLRLMNGLLRPQDGSIVVQGENLLDTDCAQLRRRLGYSIQGSGLFPHLNIRENLSIIAVREGWDSHKVDVRIGELMELFNLPSTSSFLKKKPRQLSGGQQQRIGIARALFLKPQIMFMDEPFSALDPITRSEIQKEFIRIQKILNMTIILVTHDLTEAFTMGDELVLLNQGRIEQKGKPSKFLLSPESDYVREFMESHSPGNVLKDIFLYSVVNGQVYSSYKSSSHWVLNNLESQESQKFSGEKVYAGMIVGIHTRDNDLEVNVLKGKKLTNIRAAGKDDAVKLTPPIRMTLERALSWIQDDELVEVTPKSIRLRKLYLDTHERKRFEKAKNAAA